MSQAHYTTLMEFLADIPDGRSRQGQRYEWRYLLALVAVAMLAGQQGWTAISSWVWYHRQELVRSLQPKRGQVPSAATIRRLLVEIDLEALEAQVARFGAWLDGEEPVQGRVVTQQGEVLKGQALDGKSVRGASVCGASVHLVSVVRHASATVLGQRRVATKIDERQAAQALLVGEMLEQSVTTADALHTQVKLVKQIVAGGGHYLLVVKANQPTLYHEIADAFSVLPPLNRLEAEFWTYEQVESSVRAHGRLERRSLESTTALNDYLTWPHVAQVLRRTCWRQELRSGRIRQQLHFGITSLSRSEVTLAQIEQLWRNHWTIENGLHYVRDVSLGEDGCRVRTTSAPQALAALRNAIVSLVRHEGWSFVPNALRHFDHHLQDALRLIGAVAT